MVHMGLMLAYPRGLNCNANPMGVGNVFKKTETGGSFYHMWWTCSKVKKMLQLYTQILHPFFTACILLLHTQLHKQLILKTNVG